MYSPDSQECGFLAIISLNRNSRSPKLVVTTILAVAEKASVGSMRNVSPIKVASSITVLLPVGVEATFPVATSLQTNFGLPFFVVVVGISVNRKVTAFSYILEFYFLDSHFIRYRSYFLECKGNLGQCVVEVYIHTFNPYRARYSRQYIDMIGGGFFAV